MTTKSTAVLGAFLLGVLATGCASAVETTDTTEGTQVDQVTQAHSWHHTARATTGPITGGRGTAFGSTGTVIPLADHGYVEEELYLDGTATSYARAGTWTTDGNWGATPGATAPYRTRLLVRRPAKKSRFNGTVIVEWMNTSSGWDIPHHFLYAHDEILRDGYAWVGVSAQFVGVTPTPYSLKNWDPARYASLNHPGDGFALDIFTQAGEVVRDRQQDVLGDLRARNVIASGFSSAAGGLSTYVNAIQPLTNEFDGFLLHGRTVSGFALGGAVPPASRIRSDVRVPVMSIQDEWSLTNGTWQARQPDSNKFRLWEIAGTAHVDGYANTYADPIISRDLGFPPLFCVQPQNSAPLHWVVKAALQNLTLWMDWGLPPTRSPYVEVASGAIVRDAYGNAKGGVRLPQLEVPLASYAATGNVGAPPCALAGSTTPFTPATVASLYPTERSYDRPFLRALLELQLRRMVLAPEAAEARRNIHEDDIP